MKILVTGGAGYIGSHTIVELIRAGFETVVVDNFSNSHPGVLARLAKITGQTIPFFKADVANVVALRRIFAETRPDAVIHFAGFKAVGESVKTPLAYYRNNLLSTVALSEVMVETGVKTIVFSSSATVYGAPKTVPITERAGLAATNPYGQTKLMCEQILRDAAQAHEGLNVAILRYFNPVGAHPSGLIGEDPDGVPNNLMPYVAQVAIGRRPHLKVFGSDYTTPDGTGVRDYLHVVDLARAHVAAVRGASKRQGVATYNLGTGRGYSVLEVVGAFEAASQQKVPYELAARRPGDVAECYADPALAERELGWKAEKTLQDMCADQWNWQSRNPHGFSGGFLA